MLKRFNTCATFVLGLSSPVVLYLAQFAVRVLTSQDRGAAMRASLLNSFPWNIIGAVAFFASLGFMLWYGGRKDNQDKIEKERQERILEGKFDAVKTSIDRLADEIRQDRSERRK